MFRRDQRNDSRGKTNGSGLEGVDVEDESTLVLTFGLKESVTDAAREEKEEESERWWER